MQAALVLASIVALCAVASADETIHIDQVASLAYLPIEWPSHDWLVDKTRGAKRLALADMIQVSVDFSAMGGPPSQIARSKLPPCTLGAPLPLDKLQTASGIPLVYRDCSRPDLSHTSAAEPWFTRRASRTSH